MIKAKTILNLVFNADYQNYMPDLRDMRANLNIDEIEMMLDIVKDNAPYLLTLEK